jgi:hypothetical protein
VSDGYLLRDLDNGDRVIHVERVRGGIGIQEACDGWFGVVLTPERLEQFITDLRAVAAEPEPPEDE